MLKNFLFLYYLGFTFLCFSISLKQEPICIIPTPGSLLNLKDKPVPLQNAGGRPRFSTCGGVAWFHNDNYIATINFGLNAVYTYKLDSEKRIAIPLQVITNKQGASLSWPENISISDDSALIAISNCKTGTVNIYNINPRTHLINPKPANIIKYKENFGAHGVRFSPQAKYLAFTTAQKFGLIYVYKIDKANNKILIKEPFFMEDPYLPLKPKAIDFSKDSKFVAIIYSPNANANVAKESLLTIHAFDNKTGKIDLKPICMLKLGITQVDDVIFTVDNSYLIIGSQAKDNLIFCRFDKKTGVLGNSFIGLQNPKAQLSFPHGIGISSNGKYLAVSNYGDDKVSIYSIES